MIIFLYGPDSYRRQEKLKEIIAEYKGKHSSFSVESFNLEETAGLDKLKDFAKAQSLFDDLKLGIIRGGGDLEKKEQKEYSELLKENLKSKDPVLIVLENKRPVKEFKFLLEKPARFQEFENLTGDKLQDFLQKEIKNRELVLDKESQNLLMAAYSGDTWGLVTELDKLSLLDPIREHGGSHLASASNGASEKKINKKILENHLDIFLPVNIYNIINEMRNSKSAGARLSLLEELFSRSQDPAMIFNIAAVAPYADEKWKEKIADYDAGIKSGKLEYEEALLDLILN